MQLWTHHLPPPCNSVTGASPQGSDLCPQLRRTIWGWFAIIFSSTIKFCSNAMRHLRNKTKIFPNAIKLSSELQMFHVKASCDKWLPGTRKRCFFKIKSPPSNTTSYSPLLLPLLGCCRQLVRRTVSKPSPLVALPARPRSPAQGRAHAGSTIKERDSFQVPVPRRERCRRYTHFPFLILVCRGWMSRSHS